MRAVMRAATPAEAAEDYEKRAAALDRAEAQGLYSDRQLEQHRAELETFTGYPRLESGDPGPCGLGVCSAEDGHEGSCDEASGWALVKSGDSEATK